jgi:hypothetical protein
MPVGQHLADLGRDRSGDLGWPGFQQDLGDLAREFLRTEQSPRKRGDEDQERKQRHQNRERDMACDRPAIVAQERQQRVIGEAKGEGERAQRCLRAEAGGIACGKKRSAPYPLAGEGRGRVSGGGGTNVPHSPTPTPDPSPQGGGEKKRATCDCPSGGSGQRTRNSIAAENIALRLGQPLARAVDIVLLCIATSTKGDPGARPKARDRCRLLLRGPMPERV